MMFPHTITAKMTGRFLSATQDSIFRTGFDFFQSATLVQLF